MNKIQPLDQVKSIVASALNRTAKVRKNFGSFFIEKYKYVHNLKINLLDNVIQRDH